MPILDAFVWLIIIAAVVALGLWALSMVNLGRFAYPIRVVLIAVAVIVVVYIVGGLLLSFAPPFPGR